MRFLLAKAGTAPESLIQRWGPGFIRYLVMAVLVNVSGEGVPSVFSAGEIIFLEKNCCENELRQIRKVNTGMMIFFNTADDSIVS